MEDWLSFHNVTSLFTQNHGKQPRADFLFIQISILALVGTASLIFFRSLTKKNATNLMKSFGIRIKKIARASMEIERKAFHLTGLGVPLAHHISTSYFGWSKEHFVKFCWFCTISIWVGDVFRVLVPSSMDYYPYKLLSDIIRKKEVGALSGTCYFSLGSTLAVALFPPAVAMTSITWLVVGDMSAALIGVSFGGETCSLKMGREGRKSLEGSVAMFVSCTAVGLVFFSGVRLSDYAVIIGSLASTLVELYEPFGINDNITIPFVGGAVLQWALARVENCVSNK